MISIHNCNLGAFQVCEGVGIEGKCPGGSLPVAWNQEQGGAGLRHGCCMECAHILAVALEIEPIALSKWQGELLALLVLQRLIICQRDMLIHVRDLQWRCRVVGIADGHVMLNQWYTNGDL